MEQFEIVKIQFDIVNELRSELLQRYNTIKMTNDIKDICKHVNAYELPICNRKNIITDRRPFYKAQKSII